MCHILSVDHTPCKHTVAIYQHCIDAPKSRSQGQAACSNIKQHSRAILTRKPCAGCGGPRFFARRGAIAERGLGTTTLADLITEKENEKADLSDANDSGYHSERAEDAEEDDDFPLSPKTSALNVKSWRRRLRKRDLESRERYLSSSKGRKPSWMPNLKQELSDE
ncbi:hypothetical protein B0J11DRAFT_417782, partial [Dendryphion nanum]